MTKPEEIIEKLKFTVAMCEYDPLTGDIIERCFMNDMTRTTYDACKAAIEFIEKHQYVHDKCKKCIEFSEFEQQESEDCISREQTLKAFAEKCGGECACCEYNGSGYDNAENCKLIKSMPSVTPKGVTITDFADRCRECGRINPCEDCISRDAVEKITWEEPSYDDALNVLTEVRDKVRALPSVKPEIKWIPVSEKLPNSYEHILATMISPVTQLPFVNKIYTGENAKEKIEEAKVIAWMALPKPYKENI